jgi:glycine/D-amino acid oxidase-like deaminating enzyme
MPPKKIHDSWGISPWTISYSSRNRHAGLPRMADFVVIGGGFTGLAAAVWLRRFAPGNSVVVLEAGQVGAGASGRTGGMALSDSAAGKLVGLRDVLSSLQTNLEALEIDCDLDLCGAWEIARQGLDHRAPRRSPIGWHDSGTLRVVNEVPGGTLDPGKLVSGLARAAARGGALLLESHRVLGINWLANPEIQVVTSSGQIAKITGDKILFATNALSLANAGLHEGMHPRLTLAVLTAPVTPKLL